VLVTTLARFAAPQQEAMDAAMAERSEEPWYEAAVAAVEKELAGDFETDEEIGALWDKERYLYFEKIGEVEQAYLNATADEKVNADTLRFFNKEVFETFDLRPELPNITSSALVVVGESDFITGPVAAANITAGIPHAETLTLPCGHFVFVEQRDAFRDGVAKFLEKA
jgi:pimeloyl-ACP methyl ester carboxylesterase